MTLNKIQNDFVSNKDVDKDIKLIEDDMLELEKSYAQAINNLKGSNSSSNNSNLPTKH